MTHYHCDAGHEVHILGGSTRRYLCFVLTPKPARWGKRKVSWRPCGARLRRMPTHDAPIVDLITIESGGQDAVREYEVLRDRLAQAETAREHYWKMYLAAKEGK